jgi:hypothetical protein
MKKVNFRDWTVEKVEDAFGLEQTFNHPLLKQLISFSYEVSEFEAKTLLEFQQNYEQFDGKDWNEVELASNFMSPLIVFSDMDNRKFGYFLERDLSVTIGEYELVGKTD